MKFIIRNEGIRESVLAEVRNLSLEHPWAVTIKPYHPTRSLEQNSFLHAVPLQLLSDATGHSKDELKDYLMGEAFGWEEYSIMDKPHSRPVKRSSQLTTKEFTWFLEWIEAWAAEKLGIIVPRPNEYLE